MICQKCGATISDTEACCSYCGYTIYENAQKAYFEELDEIRKDVEDLTFIPQTATKDSARKMVKTIATILIVLAILLLLYFVIYWRII